MAQKIKIASLGLYLVVDRIDGGMQFLYLEEVAQLMKIESSYIAWSAEVDGHFTNAAYFVVPVVPESEKVT